MKREITVESSVTVEGHEPRVVLRRENREVELKPSEALRLACTLVHAVARAEADAALLHIIEERVGVHDEGALAEVLRDVHRFQADNGHLIET
jgi:hypothetical protein